MIDIPTTDTPTIFGSDINTLEWAARFAAGPTGQDGDADRADMIGKELPAMLADPFLGYPELCGTARARTDQLLRIINRLAEQTRQDRDTIKEQRDRLAQISTDLTDARREIVEVIGGLHSLRGER